eukprot:Opistho-2@40391
MTITMSFLADLPSFDRNNFANIQNHRYGDSFKPSYHGKPLTYTPTHDRTQPPPDQQITTEKTNILLRYLYEQLETKSGAGAASVGAAGKRDMHEADLLSETPLPPSKYARRD